jgi:recombination protein RecA
MANKLVSKKSDLEQTLSTINREFGNGSIMRLGDASHMNVKTFSSGSTELDLALGGGYPRGRILEIYGHFLSRRAYFLLIEAITN